MSATFDVGDVRWDVQSGSEPLSEHIQSGFSVSVGKAIVRRSAGIWQRGGLESSPMLAPIQPASFPRALEVSLSRALNGFTKLITSFSAFLKEPKATQVQTSRGSPLSR